MSKLQNFVCKSVGTVGMSLALYDAYKLASKKSDRMVLQDTADHYADTYFSSRTLSTESEINSALQDKVRDMRMKNPILPIVSKIKGFIAGGLESLANNFIPVAFSALALTTKGLPSKIGAWGATIYGGITILREGFGIGKNNPKI